MHWRFVRLLVQHVVFPLSRRVKLQAELHLMSWRVKWEEIETAESRKVRRQSRSSNSNPQLHVRTATADNLSTVAIGSHTARSYNASMEMEPVNLLITVKYCMSTKWVFSLSSRICSVIKSLLNKSHQGCYFHSKLHNEHCQDGQGLREFLFLHLVAPSFTFQWSVIND